MSLNGVITDTGFTALNDMLNDSSADHALYIAYGTGTTAATASDTEMETEVDRAAASTVEKSGSSFRIQHEFTINSAAEISEVGVFDDERTSGTPILTAGTTYYMVWTADYDISGTNYIWVCGRSTSIYADGTFYAINGADAWDDRTKDAHFKIYGKEYPNGTEELLVNNSGMGGAASDAPLRNHADRTKFAQSFELPGSGDYYITKIEWRTRQIGSVSGDVWIEIHRDQSGTQIGSNSAKVDCSTIHTGGSSWTAPMFWDVVADSGGGNMLFHGVATSTDIESMTSGQTYDVELMMKPEAGSY